MKLLSNMNGFTLIELIVSIVLGVVILSLIGIVITFVVLAINLLG